MNDIVYILRDGDNPELKYSLRSVEKNFPHRKVWIYGGKPNNIRPDEFVRINQQGSTKWQKVRNTLVEVCKNDNITEDFWLFNDDFFIMKKIEDPQNHYDGTLSDRIDQIESANGKSQYSNNLRQLCRQLYEMGIKEPLNYAHHTPMLINRKKMLKTLEEYPDQPMFRALYGNINQIGGVQMPDVKFYRNRQPFPIGAYASTADESWLYEKIGRIIREKFSRPSKWEV